jgi:DNA repair protein RecO (recombination protein O)
MKEKIIILRTFKWRESDIMVHAINPRGGRMHFLARGAAKSRKRFGGGVLEPTHYILASYRPSPSRDDEAPLHTLQEAELLKGFNGLRDRLDRLELALEMVAMIAKVAQPGVEDSPELFDLLGNGLYAAESTFHAEILRVQFEAKLLYLLGSHSGHAAHAALLGPTLKDHAQINIPPEEFNQLRREIHNSMQRYLQGLGPLESEGVEI